MTNDEWPQVGDSVIVYQPIGSGSPILTGATVDRLTRTTIVLNRGKARYRRSDLKQMAASDYRPTPFLVRVDDERIGDAYALKAVERARADASDAVNAWLKDRRDLNRANIAALALSAYQRSAAAYEIYQSERNAQS